MIGIATFVLFAPVIQYDFVNLDDDLYVYDNPAVQQGLTVPGLRWACGGAHHGYWLPVLWLSYMVDTQMFGTGPAGYHFTNVLLHALNATMVFLLLGQLTGCWWRSGLVAALFGWHPLRVESVAWITERKDVLSLWFGLLAMWAYCRYAQGSGVISQKAKIFSLSSDRRPLSSGFYWLGLILFVVGLMSKPILVSLPMVLLLLDVWPLRRVGLSWGELRAGSWGLVREKWAWWAVAVVFSGLTYYTQANTGAVISGERIPFTEQVSEVPVAYWFYVAKTLLPTGLAVVYPGLGFTWSGCMLAVVFLIGVTVAVARARSRSGALAAGWVWFVVTLLPVVGLVRAGVAQVADRFTYLPSIGLFIMLAWGLAELASGYRYRRPMLLLTGTMALVGCVVTTWFQLGHWRNSLTLFEHTLAVTANNALANNKLGFAFFQQGRMPEAIVYFERALQINPEYAEARGNLGEVLIHLDRLPEAIAQYEQVLRINPNLAEAHYNLGVAMFRLGRLPEAIAQYEQVLRINPDFAEAHKNLAAALFQLGRVSEAIGHLQEVLRLKPADVKVRNSLAVVLFQLGKGLAAQGKRDEAIAHYREAAQLDPNDPQTHNHLANALAEQGKLEEAVQHYTTAVQLQRDNPELHYNLGLALARQGRRAEAMQHLSEALRLRPDYAEARRQLDALAAQPAK